MENNLNQKQRLIADTYRRVGTIKGTADETGIPRTTVRHTLKRIGLYGKAVASGTREGLKHEVLELPKKGKVFRYLLTSAQNNTRINKGVWTNLLALAEYYDAEIMVSRFSYNTGYFGTQPNKPGESKTQDEMWYDPAIKDYKSDERIELAPGLMWCGENNTLPTAARPLSGFETYTGGKSGIFPHVKIAMESIATGNDEPTKFNYTTGTVTQMNYVHRKAGLKAEHHHCYGALLVEVDHEGNWWCRQLNADKKNVIHDLDVKVDKGVVTEGHRVEAINWGDIHEQQIDPVMKEVAWGPGGMFDELRPKHQFMHDLFDMYARNHHNKGNPHVNFARHVDKMDSVESEVRSCAQFLDSVCRKDCKTIVVDSNHDNALLKWLRETDYRSDPINAMYFLELQLAVYKSIAAQDEEFHLLEKAVLDQVDIKHVQFLRADESFRISGDIECGMHGDKGPNGAKGSALGFTKMGHKANIGHSHSAGIYDGIYQAGVTGKLKQGYNTGPSGWSHTHTITHENGKRQQVTVWEGKWRA